MPAAGIRWGASEEIPRVSFRPARGIWLPLVRLCVGVSLESVITVIVCVSSRDKSRLILVFCFDVTIQPRVTRIGLPTLHSGI